MIHPMKVISSRLVIIGTFVVFNNGILILPEILVTYLNLEMSTSWLKVNSQS